MSVLLSYQLHTFFFFLSWSCCDTAVSLVVKGNCTCSAFYFHGCHLPTSLFFKIVRRNLVLGHLLTHKIFHCFRPCKVSARTFMTSVLRFRQCQCCNPWAAKIVFQNHFKNTCPWFYRFLIWKASSLKPVHTCSAHSTPGTALVQHCKLVTNAACIGTVQPTYSANSVLRR